MNIDYTFKIDGFYHSVNYYRSESPMDINNMPAATASGITGLSYSDTTALPNKQYYVRFGSVKGDVEKISEQLTINTTSFNQKVSFTILSTNQTGMTLSNENRTIDISTGVQDRRWVGVAVDHLADSSIRYFEVTINNLLNSFDRFEFGLSTNGANTTYTGKYLVNGLGRKKQGSAATTEYTTAFAIGDKIGVSIQAVGGNSQIVFYKNGVSLGVAFTVAGVVANFRPALAYIVGGATGYNANLTINKELSDSAKSIENLTIW